MFDTVCESQLTSMDIDASVLPHFMAMTLFAVQLKPKIFFIMPPVYQFPAVSSHSSAYVFSMISV